MTEQQLEDPLKHAVQNEDVEALCQAFFDVELYPVQEKIVRDIAFQKNNRLIINTYTQFGKSFSIGVGVALLLLLNGENMDDFEIDIIGPTMSDAEKVRDDLLQAGLESREFADMIDISRGSDPEDLMKSASKSQITFLDGNVRVKCLSASSGSSGKGSGLMGSGADIIVLDESNRVSESTYKENIERMLNSEDSVLIEAGNPFHKDNQFYRHWTDDRFIKYHVSDEKGVEIGRHSKQFFDNKAGEIGGRNSLEYKVLYRSEFPDQVDDALIAHSWIERAEKNSFSFESPEIIYGADIAGSGDDKIVVTRLEKQDGKHRLTDQWSKGKSSDTGELAHWIQDRVPERPEEVDRFVVDAVGIGAGVHSKLKELGFEPTKFKAGEKPNSEEDRFQNKKARNFFKVRDTLQENDLQICDGFSHGRGNSLVHELTHIKTERRARDKIKIVDPDSGSPDFADSLMMSFYSGGDFFIL
ncbi:putative phage terminase B protein [environmental Halophage eHP-35]|nr:putative phage terminase B protein [environmental Halophage eHP-35]